MWTWRLRRDDAAILTRFRGSLGLKRVSPALSSGFWGGCSAEVTVNSRFLESFCLGFVSLIIGLPKCIRGLSLLPNISLFLLRYTLVC